MLKNVEILASTPLVKLTDKKKKNKPLGDIFLSYHQQILKAYAS